MLVVRLRHFFGDGICSKHFFEKKTTTKNIKNRLLFKNWRERVMEDIEASAKTSEAISKFLFDITVRKDLESGKLFPSDAEPDRLREEYVGILDCPDVWERLNCHVSEWSRKAKDVGDLTDSDAMNKIMSRHSRFPTIEKITNVMGTEAGTSYREALEKLESTSTSKICLEVSKVERWKRRSLEIIYSLVVNVLAPHMGTGLLAKKYAAWHKQTYSVAQRECPVMKSKRSFWQKSGVWIVGKSDENGWMLYSRRYGGSDTRKKIRKLIETCKRFRKVIKENGSRCLRCIPKKRPSYRAASTIDENLEKMEAYIAGCKASATKKRRKK